MWLSVLSNLNICMWNRRAQAAAAEDGLPLWKIFFIASTISFPFKVIGHIVKLSDFSISRLMNRVNFLFYHFMEHFIWIWSISECCGKRPMPRNARAHTQAHRVTRRQQSERRGKSEFPIGKHIKHSNKYRSTDISQHQNSRMSWFKWQLCVKQAKQQKRPTDNKKSCASKYEPKPQYLAVACQWTRGYDQHRRQPHFQLAFER